MTKSATVTLVMVFVILIISTPVEANFPWWGWQDRSQQSWDYQRPCGRWTPTCTSALERAGFQPYWASPVEFRNGTPMTWLQAFGWVQWCESRHNPWAHRANDEPITGAPSRGLWQINTFFHPEVTPLQAYDPVWSTFWAADHWFEGNATLWTCYRILMSR